MRAARILPLLLTIGVAACAPAISLRAVSTRADMVTGGDVLIEAPATAAPFTALLDGRDVSASFQTGQDGVLRGLLQGLSPGNHRLTITSARGRATLTLRNLPITGPAFSGDHQTPFRCQTEEGGLGPPVDGDCSAPTQVTYAYRSTEQTPARAGTPGSPALPVGFKPYDPVAPTPRDIARLKTPSSPQADYIVRRERGTINRSVYQIAMPVDGENLSPTLWRKSSGWNGRLVFSFGGGCGEGHQQGTTNAGLRDEFLSRGYAVAVASLTVFANTCDDVLSAETAMMVKEHFVEEFGPPVHTIGTGGSGGAILQYALAQNYPGILDGLTPSIGFPDNVVFDALADCALLARAFSGASESWSQEQKAATSGYATFDTCTSGWLGGSAAPGSLNVRLQHRPFDNVGVQYGLVAFNAGRISAEQFVSVNEQVGGYASDGTLVAQRRAADPASVERAYRTGRVNVGGGALGRIPIVDARPYLDTSGNQHDRVRSLVMRERLRRSTGSSGNMVTLLFPPDGPEPLDPGEIVALVDGWLDAIDRDTSVGNPVAKTVRNRPAGLVDACWTIDGNKIEEPHVGSASRCNELYPVHRDPRIAAGGPLASDVLKCTLKPLDASDYTHSLPPEQLARLRALFPSGVCNYTKPGLGQRGRLRTWQSY